MKLIINTCYGGWELSEAACRMYYNIQGIDALDKEIDDLRIDPVLIDIIEKIGSKASSPNADLRIIEIPDGVDWIIQDYDGIEWVAEKHRIWGFSEGM
jgi:hypothetical protein